MELITQQAMKAGFTGGIVNDYPNSTKAKKLAFYTHYMYVYIICNVSCNKKYFILCNVIVIKHYNMLLITFISSV